MTEQEAINRISYLKNKADVALSTTKSKCSWAKEDVAGTIKAFDVAIKALGKQVAKKPFMNDRNCGFWTCPSCNYELYWDSDYGQQKFEHCSYCGQKLDWSDEDDNH